MDVITSTISRAGRCTPEELSSLDDSAGSSVTSEIYCLICGLPDNFEDSMVACDMCNNWYHYPCVNLDSDADLEDAEWMCDDCTV